MRRASATFRVALFSVFVVVLMFSFVGVANTATPAKEGLLVVNSSTNNSDSPSYFGEGVRATVSAVEKDGLLYNCSWTVERWPGSDVVKGWPRSAEVNGNLYIIIWADEYEMYGEITENWFYGFASGPFTNISASAGGSFYSSELGCTSCNTDKAQLPEK